LSPGRILLALALVVLGAVGGWLLVDRSSDAAEGRTNSTTWSAPYVDVTVLPRFAFESPGDDVSDVVLSFVVAHRDDPCVPAWGGLFDLDAAASELDVDRRVVRLRQTGRDAIVSFGGALNDEIAVTCSDGPALAEAYRSVIERYELHTIDLDLEGHGLADRGAHERRAVALAEIQQQRREDGAQLAVWLTLPVTPEGLTEEGVAAIDATLAGGVDIAGVNIMVMNFGASRDQGMVQTAETAVEATVQQVLGAWRRAGRWITPTEAAARVGVTPMIGRNDVVSDQFTLSDARELVALVEREGLGRASYWSLNRDRSCGPNDEPIATPSDMCSHLEQSEGAFAREFAVITGRSADDAGTDIPWAMITLVEDDPDLSPYPIWRPDRSFAGGEKVVWHGYVYEAKWWTTAENPERPVVNVWDTPWRIVGPVLPGDLVQPALVPEGIVDEWDPEAVYVDGDRVWLSGAVYEAKWWNEAFPPNRGVAHEWESPWLELDPDLFVQPSES